MNEFDRNKANVTAFYCTIFDEYRSREEIEPFAGDDYIRHNPHVAAGKEGFVEYFKRMAREHSAKVGMRTPRFLATGSPLRRTTPRASSAAAQALAGDTTENPPSPISRRRGNWRNVSRPWAYEGGP